jgi:preprotein translocase subunit SecY
MASAAEQLAANLNFGAFAKATELKKRLWFTLGAMIIYRLGTYVPVPGIDPTALADVFNANSHGILGMFDMFAGGALRRFSMFALNVMPYISSSIIMQLLTAISPQIEALKKEGEAGRKKINQLTLTGGTLFLMWLGEQVTARGVGNGVSLIIFAGIVANLPNALAQTLELGRTGAISPVTIIALIAMGVVVIGVIVFMERAQRRIIVQYPKRQQGSRVFGGESSHLPLKLNASGVIPPIFASSLLLLPATVVGFTGGAGPDWLGSIGAYIAHGRPLYMVAYVALIVFFCFFYSSIVFNPNDTADNLKKYGGFIPGIRPGKNTADYLSYILTRLTVVGAIYLSVICLLPEILISQYSVPFYFGGTSLLIVVSVTMDTVAQIQAHLLAHQYEGLIKKSKLRGRRG